MKAKLMPYIRIAGFIGLRRDHRRLDRHDHMIIFI